MKLLFVHGSRSVIKDDKGNLYAEGAYCNELWERYYCLTNNLTVLTRQDVVKHEMSELGQRYHLLDKDKYRFIAYQEDEKKLDEEVKNTDLLIVRVPSSVSYKAIEFAIKYNKKYLIEVVGCPLDAGWSNKGINKKIKALREYFALKKYVKNAPYVLYVTNEFLQKRYPTNGHACGCSDVALTDVSEDLLESRLKKIESTNENSTIKLCTVGTIDLKIKGHRFVIKAIAKLKKENLNFEYDIVGAGDKGPLEELAKKLNVEDRVHFLGLKTHDEVFNIMKQSDIYIQPSESEGLARVLVEAISVASPCIASNVGGNSEVVTDKRFTFKSKNVQSLVQTLKRMTKEEMKKQARINFEHSKEFNMQKLNKKRYEFYKDFAS